MAQISHSRGPLAELITRRFALIEVSVMHLSERCLKRCSKHRFNQELASSLAILKSFPLSFYSQATCRAAYRAVLLFPRGPTDWHLPPQTEACSEGWNATEGWDRNTSSRLDTALCDAEWPIVSALCITFLCAALHEPFPILG